MATKKFKCNVCGYKKAAVEIPETGRRRRAR